jgi:hypothetical protein
LFRTLRERYYIPEIVWHKLNLVNNAEMIRQILNLFDKRVVPFRVIADVFGWNMKTIEKWIKSEVGTPFDPKWREIINEIIKQEKIKEEYLKQKKLDEIIDKYLFVLEQEKKKKEKEGEEVSEAFPSRAKPATEPPKMAPPFSETPPATKPGKVPQEEKEELPKFLGEDLI